MPLSSNLNLKYPFIMGMFSYKNFLTAWISDNFIGNNAQPTLIKFNSLVAQYLRIFGSAKWDKTKSMRTSCLAILLPLQKPISHQAAETHHPIYRKSGKSDSWKKLETNGQTIIAHQTNACKILVSNSLKWVGT